MKYQMDNWLLVRIGIEDGGMRVRDTEELEEHIYYFKDMMREHSML